MPTFPRFLPDHAANQEVSVYCAHIKKFFGAKLMYVIMADPQVADGIIRWAMIVELQQMNKVARTAGPRT